MVDNEVRKNFGERCKHLCKQKGLKRHVNGEY